jgi:hypothetical protein
MMTISNNEQQQGHFVSEFFKSDGAVRKTDTVPVLLNDIKRLVHK